nr:MAG TPA: hypothetical protein [Caudoviricetes sp.]
MLLDLDLLLAKPKGAENPFLYYPESYSQDKSQSIITADNKYDLKRFSSHESSVIQQVIFTAFSKYSARFQSLGLANESCVIVYKPRYVLFEIATIMYENSSKPEDILAAAYAYSQKGASFRTHAISLYEKSVDSVSFRTLDKFASLYSAIVYSDIASLYEKEQNYESSIYWMKKVIKRGGLNNRYYLEKISCLENKSPPATRKAKPISNSQAEFEKNVRAAALHFMGKFDLRVQTD